jgi:hypothetical protein
LDKIKFSSGLFFFINYLSKILLPLLPLFLVFQNLSSTQINVYLLITVLSTIGQGVQNGFRSSFVRFLSYSVKGLKIHDFNRFNKNNFKSYNNEDKSRETTSYLFVVFLKIYSVLSILYFFLTLILGYLFLNSQINNLEDVLDGKLSFVLFIFLSTISLYFNIYSIYLSSINKVDSVEKTRFLFNIIIIIIYVIFYEFLDKLLYLIILNQIGLLLSNLVLRYKVYNIENLRFKLNFSLPFRMKYFKIIWSNSFKNGVGSLIANISGNIIGLITPQLFNTGLSNAYLLTKKAIDTISEISFIPFNAYSPNLSYLRVKSKLDNFIKNIIKIEILTYFLLFLGVVFFLQTKDFLIFLIGNPELVFLNDNLLFLLIIFSFQSRWSSIKLFISNICNYVIEHYSIALNFVVLFSLIILFWEKASIYNLLFFLMISHLISSIFIFKLFYSKNFNISFVEYEKKQLILVLIFLLLLWIINLN